MKKVCFVLMIVAIGLLLMVPMAGAYSISVGDQIKLYQGVGGANSGGSFDVDKLYDGEGLLFSTFCLERNEYFTPGSAMYIGSISDSAVLGGYGGAINGADPISEETAFLYYKWATGQIDHTKANANNLQLAIWSLEGEITTQHPLTITSGALAFIESAAIANGFYGVQVMNLYGNKTVGTTSTEYSNPKQSQLIYTPVPEPTSMLLLGLGLIGLAGIRRKIQK